MPDAIGFVARSAKPGAIGRLPRFSRGGRAARVRGRAQRRPGAAAVRPGFSATD